MVSVTEQLSGARRRTINVSAIFHRAKQLGDSIEEHLWPFFGATSGIKVGARSRVLFCQSKNADLGLISTHSDGYA